MQNAPLIHYQEQPGDPGDRPIGLSRRELSWLRRTGRFASLPPVTASWRSAIDRAQRLGQVPNHRTRYEYAIIVSLFHAPMQVAVEPVDLILASRWRCRVPGQ